MDVQQGFKHLNWILIEAENYQKKKLLKKKISSQNSSNDLMNNHISLGYDRDWSIDVQ